jgi:hypothetical protein
MTKKSLTIKVSEKIGNVSAIFHLKAGMSVFAHGAGAGMKNKFMEQASLLLAGLE